MADTVFGDLWNNWMFRLSLSSNELFHSNFLQLVLTDPAAPERDSHGGPSSWKQVEALARWAGLDQAWLSACEEQYGASPISVYREWKRLDLAVVATSQEGREVVLFAVELKIKSYPTLAQLQRYLAEMVDHNAPGGGFLPRLILLSLAGAPAGAEGQEGLHLMDFGQLAACIAALPPALPSLAPATAEYVRFCNLLHQLGLHWQARLGPQLSLHEVMGSEQPYRRFQPIWSKLCAAYLCKLVAGKMEGFEPDGRLTLETVPGFSNGNWSADFLWSRASAANAGGAGRTRPQRPVAKVGVQVEGRTIRFMLNAEHVRTRNGDPRKLVEDALLAAATRDGLFARLYELHAGMAPGTGNVFWERRPGFAQRDGSLPVLSSARGTGGYRLTGYTNNAGFGHADYRLQLDPAADLETIAVVVADALQGRYNDKAAAAFRAVLEDPAVFAQA